MRVNFAFTGFFTIFFIASSFTDHSDRDLRAKQVNLIIRQIGHRLLLQAGDSTSRVLPVTEIKEGTFLLRFENEFVFNHDSLMVLSKGLLLKTQFPSGYTVTVHDCMKGDIVYGFQVNNTTPDILACRGRSQPPGCYTIEFAFPDFYENVKQKKVGYPFINLVYGGILVLLVVALLIWHNHTHAIVKEPVPELAALGKFLFNVKGQRLLLGSEVISLTDKECKVLELLHKNFGELIPRETLMQEVWINEGVITGRSLDMFVSKLRKKLSRDPELRITNVHGKGYKLEIPESQII